MRKIIKYGFLFLLLSLFSATAFSQTNEGEESTEQTASDTATESDNQQPAATDETDSKQEAPRAQDEFRPSEEISDDLSVSFPVDI